MYSANEISSLQYAYWRKVSLWQSVRKLFCAYADNNIRIITIVLHWAQITKKVWRLLCWVCRNHLKDKDLKSFLFYVGEKKILVLHRPFGCIPKLHIWPKLEFFYVFQLKCTWWPEMMVFDLKSLLDGLRPEILNLFRDEPESLFEPMAALLSLSFLRLLEQ